MESLLLRAALLVGAVVVCALVAGVLRRRAGRVRAVTDGGVLSPADVDQPLGTAATLVQ